LIVGEGAGKSIKIDQVRALQREAVLSPYEARYRVFILRQIDLASTEAANSLLKTLEEPPEHVILVLTAEHADELPPTVVSRCQRLELRPAARSIVKDVLQDRGLPDDQSQLLARLSGGRLGWALQACQDGTLMSQRQRDLDQLTRLLPASRVERLDYALKASRDPDTSRALIEQWIGWWRDLLLLRGQGERYLSNIDRIHELRSLAEQTTVPQAWTVLRVLQTAAAQLEANVNTRLALESLVLNLPHLQPPRVSQGTGISN
jgi:DNA polymerase-3 subunit delta'